jgi:hypothetical protein
VHSKKIGTVLSVGLIHLFLFRFINPVGDIGLPLKLVKSFLDKADIAAALHACDSNPGNIVGMCVEAHIFVQIVN